MSSHKSHGHQSSAHSQPSTRHRSLWESYKVLPARTRLYISMAMCTVGAAGIFVSDYLEKKLPDKSGVLVGGQ